MNIYFFREEFSAVNAKRQQIGQDQNNFKNAMRNVIHMGTV